MFSIKWVLYAICIKKGEKVPSAKSTIFHRRVQQNVKNVVITLHLPSKPLMIHGLYPGNNENASIGVSILEGIHIY